MALQELGYAIVLLEAPRCGNAVAVLGAPVAVAAAVWVLVGPPAVACVFVTSFALSLAGSGAVLAMVIPSEVVAGVLDAPVVDG